MDIYSSTANLVSTNKQDKTLYPSKHSIVQNELGRESKRRKKRGQNGGGYAGMMIVGILNLAMVIAIAIIGAVYISHLQEHVGRLEQRVEVLEARSCDQKEDVRSLKEFEEAEAKQIRVRRKSRAGATQMRVRIEKAGDINSPSQNQQLEGIGINDIAMVYGSTCKMDKVVNSTEFKKITDRKRKKDCSRLYEREKDKQLWCDWKLADGKKEVSSYMTTRYNKEFQYFEKAAWMNSTNFHLTDAGEIEVHKDGIYIVHASVQFTDVTLSTNAHYAVYKISANGRTHKLSRCDVSHADSESDHSRDYPCQAFQLTHLDDGDKIVMRIGGYAWFKINENALHLALIKLNGYPHHQEHCHLT